MTESHFNTAVLQALPDDQRSLDDEAAFVPSMGKFLYLSLLI
jgi:hypothetical protein